MAGDAAARTRAGHALTSSRARRRSIAIAHAAALDDGQRALAAGSDVRRYATSGNAARTARSVAARSARVSQARRSASSVHPSSAMRSAYAAASLMSCSAQTTALPSLRKAAKQCENLVRNARRRDGWSARRAAASASLARGPSAIQTRCRSPALSVEKSRSRERARFARPPCAIHDRFVVGGRGIPLPPAMMCESSDRDHVAYAGARRERPRRRSRRPTRFARVERAQLRGCGVPSIEIRARSNAM